MTKELCKCGKKYGEYVYHDFLITGELLCEECHKRNMSELSEELLRDYFEESLLLIEKLSNFIYDVAPDNDYWHRKLSIEVDDFEAKIKKFLKEKTTEVNVETKKLLNNKINSITP